MEQVEKMIQRKGKTAPRVTPEDLQKEIIEVIYHVFPGTTVTVCCLTMKNGFTVVGESACADPDNFDIEIGRKIARDNAVNKMWPLLGFRLKDRLYNGTPEMSRQESGETLPTGHQGKPVELGDQVLYFEQLEGKITDPMVAIVTALLPSNQVNLVVFAPSGNSHARVNVPVQHDQTLAVLGNCFVRPR